MKTWFDGLRAKIEGFAEARLSNPDWQSKAALHPLSRFVARRQARELFDLVAGFSYSQTLVTCERLGLLDLLHGQPAALPELAQATNTAAPALAQVLTAAVALRVLACRNGVYRLGPLGAALFGNPGVRAMIRHHEHLYADLAEPAELLRDPPQYGRMHRYWAYTDESQSKVADTAGYSQLMADSQRFVADQILATYDFSGCTCVLDIGGGYGVFIQALALRYPHLTFQLFDLPEVVAQAEVRLSELGLADRVSFYGGNLFTDDLPSGADVTTLVRILHDHNDSDIAGFLPRLYDGLAPDDRLLVAEPMAGPAAKGVEAYFCNYFLAMGQGRLRSSLELAEFVRKAGFSSVKHFSPPIPMLVEMLEAKKSL